MSNICIELHYIEYCNVLGMQNIIVIEAINDKEKREELMRRDDVVLLKAYFREPGWSEYNNDKKKFIHYNNKTDIYEVDNIEFVNYEFGKLIEYIENGTERIEMTPELVDDLHPNIANYLLNEFSKHMAVDVDYLRDLTSAAAAFYDHKRDVPLSYVPSEIIEAELAEKFGWTLDEIRSISVEDMERLLVVLNQRNYQEQSAINGGDNNDYIIDENTGMRIIGGKDISPSMRDIIAHRVKR